MKRLEKKITNQGNEELWQINYNGILINFKVLNGKVVSFNRTMSFGDAMDIKMMFERLYGVR